MVICGQGVAPAEASIERYRALDLDLVPGSGLLAATVPGAFDAWSLMLRQFGTLPLSDVIAPVIHYARDGYPLMPGICATIDIVSCSGRMAEFCRPVSGKRRAACRRYAVSKSPPGRYLWSYCARVRSRWRRTRDINSDSPPLVLPGVCRRGR